MNFLSAVLVTGPISARRSRNAVLAASKLEPGTVVEILDGSEWIRAVVDSSGVVAILQDARFPNCSGWEVPVAIDEDQREFARQWRHAL